MTCGGNTGCRGSCPHVVGHDKMPGGHIECRVPMSLRLTWDQWFLKTMRQVSGSAVTGLVAPVLRGGLCPPARGVSLDNQLIRSMADALTGTGTGLPPQGHSPHAGGTQGCAAGTAVAQRPQGQGNPIRPPAPLLHPHPNIPIPPSLSLQPHPNISMPYISIPPSLTPAPLGSTGSTGTQQPVPQGTWRPQAGPSGDGMEQPGDHRVPEHREQHKEGDRQVPVVFPTPHFGLGAAQPWHGGSSQHPTKITGQP